MSKKIIVVHGNQDVHDWMADQPELWDAQTPQFTPDEVWDSLDAGTLAEDSAALLVSDLLFTSYPDETASLIASFASSVPVIIMQEDPSLQPQIEAAVKDAVKEFKLTPAPYYWVDVTTSDEPEIEINSLIEQNSATGADELYAGYDPDDAANDSVHAGEQLEEVDSPGDYGPVEGDTYTNTLGRPGMVVVSTSTKGGSGKTTTALCVAITAAMASEDAGTPLKVITVDMDVRDGQIGFAINQTVPNALTLYLDLADKKPLTEAIPQNVIQIPRWGISTLLAPKRARTASYLDPQFYLDVIQELRKQYDLIVLDTSVNYLDPLLSQVVYPEADAILLITNLSKGAVLGLPRWMDEFTSEKAAEGIDRNKVGVVINQAQSGVGMDLALVKKAARGAPLLVAVPNDSRAVTKASNEGTLNELVSKHPQIAPEYYKLVSSLWGDRSPMVSPYEHYVASDEYQRDQQLKGQDSPDAVKSFTTPLAQADDKKPKKRRFFGK